VAIILASQSAARRQMLTAAGVPFTAQPALVDEAAAKAALAHLAPRDLADALAELKAVKLSARFPGDLVIGSDQVLETESGATLDKPGSREGAARQLRALSGQKHQLHSAAVIAEGGRPVWRTLDRATLHMRDVSDAFLTSYLDAEGEAIFGCVGSYRVEGLGIQLFSRIDGSHFTIMGMPLLLLLDYLRTRKLILV
jgi:septum formation protein